MEAIKARRRQWSSRGVRHDRAECTRTIGNDTDVERFRIAFRAAKLIIAGDTVTVAQVWFQGLNPILGDRAPALFLCEGDIADVRPQVLAAAVRQFAAVG